MYKIKEFSKMIGLSPNTLRYYEEIRIIHPNRMDNEYRLYSYQDAFKTNRFKTIQNLGFSIKEVTKIMNDPKYTDYLPYFEKEQIKITEEIKSLQEN